MYMKIRFSITLAPIRQAPPGTRMELIIFKAFSINISPAVTFGVLFTKTTTVFTISCFNIG